MISSIPAIKRINTLSLIIIGAGGHAKVVTALAQSVGRLIQGVCDPTLAAGAADKWRGLRVLGDDSVLSHFPPDEYELAMGIGAVPGSNLRAIRYLALTNLGYSFPKLIHPTAHVDESVEIADGAQIMAGAKVQADVQIGRNTIVNTSAIIDHDSKIGEHAHIAPGVVVCGGVSIGSNSFIGASATLLPNVKIGCGCLVASGSTLARDLPDGNLYAPHRLLLSQKSISK